MRFLRTTHSITIEELWDRRAAIVAFLSVAAVAALVGFAYTRLGFWVIIGALTTGAATFYLLSSPRALILTVFVAKPIVDMLWFAAADVAGLSLNASSVLSVVILVVAAVIIIIRRIALPRLLFIPMMAVLATNVWALVSTPSLAYGAEYLVRIVCGFPLVFLVCAMAEHLPGPRRMLQLFAVVMAFVCFTVVLQPLGLLPYTSFEVSGLARATGFYYHPWDVARYLVIAVPLVLALLDSREQHASGARLFYWALLLALLVVTYFTFLKAVWIAAFCEILLWLLLTGRPRAAALTLVLVVFLAAFPGRDLITSVFSDLWKLPDPESRGQALSGRVFIWSEYWTGFRSMGLREILFGQGFRPAGWVETGRAVHDDYLRILVMYGVVGLLAYASLMVATVVALARAVTRLASRRGIEWRIGIAVQCLLLAYFLMGITADPSTYPSLTLYLWLLVGLVLGYARLETRQERDADAANLGKS